MSDPATWPEERLDYLRRVSSALGVDEDAAIAIARAVVSSMPQRLRMHQMPSEDMASIEKLIASAAERSASYLEKYAAVPSDDAQKRYQAFLDSFRKELAANGMVVMMHVLTTIALDQDGEATLDRELFKEDFKLAAILEEESDEVLRVNRAQYLIHRLEASGFRNLTGTDFTYAKRLAAKAEAGDIAPYELRDLEDMTLRAHLDYEDFCTPWGKQVKGEQLSNAAIDMLKRADEIGLERLDEFEQDWVREHAAKSSLTEEAVNIAWKMYARMRRFDTIAIPRSELPKYMQDGWHWVSDGADESEVLVSPRNGRIA